MLLLILKSSACLAVFMVFYKLFLEKESMHHFKRFYLLGALVVSIIIPFITFTQYIEVAPVENLVSFTPIELTTAQGFTPETKVTWQDFLPTILWSIYLLGVILFSFRFAINLKSIVHRIKTNPKHQYHEFTNVLLQDVMPPHTFLKYIFLNKTKYENNQIPNAVLLHEQTHAKQKHALDILCIEALQIIFWFNPLLYFIKKDIKLNHEFLADNAVLQKGIDSAHYKQTLLSFSSNATEPQFTNAINYSLIKKRFTVMKTQTSKKGIWLRSFILLPLLALMLFSFSEHKEINKTSEEINLENNLSNNNLFKTIWVSIYENGSLNISNIGNISLQDFESTLTQLNTHFTFEERQQQIDGVIQIDYDTNLKALTEVKEKLEAYGVRNIMIKESVWDDNNPDNPKRITQDYTKESPNKIAKFKIDGKIMDVIDMPLNNLETKIINGRTIYLMTVNGKTTYWNEQRIPVDKNGVVIQDGATKAQIEEYNKLSKHYNSQPKNKRIYKQRDIERLKYLFELMSAEQKKNVEPFPNIAPPPPPPLPANATEAQKRKYKEAQVAARTLKLKAQKEQRVQVREIRSSNQRKKMEQEKLTQRETQVAARTLKLKAQKEQRVQVREIRSADDRKKLEQEKLAYRESQVAARTLKLKAQKEQRVQVREIRSADDRKKLKEVKLAHQESQVAARTLKLKAQKERVKVREIRSANDRKKLKEVKLAHQESQVAARVQKAKAGKEGRIMIREIMPPPPPLPKNATPEQKRKYEAAIKAYKLNQARKAKDNKKRKIKDIPPPPPIPASASVEEREQMIEVTEAYHNEVENINEVEIEEVPELEEVEVEAIENVVEAEEVEVAIQEVELEEINEVPSPESRLDHVIKMDKKGAKFYLEGKEISSDKAIQLVKNKNSLHMSSRGAYSKQPKVYLYTKPVKPVEIEAIDKH